MSSLDVRLARLERVLDDACQRCRPGRCAVRFIGSDSKGPVGGAPSPCPGCGRPPRSAITFISAYARPAELEASA